MALSRCCVVIDRDAAAAHAGRSDVYRVPNRQEAAFSLKVDPEVGERIVTTKSAATWGKAAPRQGFRGVYINLDRSTERRRNVERQLARLDLADAYLRLAAVDGRKLKPVGGLNPGIVGCFRSHVGALELASSARGVIHIAEDDIVLSRHLAPFIRHGISVGLFEDYDVVFLDLWVHPVPDLIKRYFAATETALNHRPLDYARFSVIDLKGTRIGAAASYVIAPSKLEKVHDLLKAELARGPTVPVDHHFSQLTDSGALRTAVMAPFLTTIDLKDGATSATGTLPEIEHRLFLLLRQAFYVERDLLGVVIPAMDEYRRRKVYKGLNEIRNLLAATAGIPTD